MLIKKQRVFYRCFELLTGNSITELQKDKTATVVIAKYETRPALDTIEGFRRYLEAKIIFWQYLLGSTFPLRLPEQTLQVPACRL